MTKKELQDLDHAFNCHRVDLNEIAGKLEKHVGKRTGPEAEVAHVAVGDMDAAIFLLERAESALFKLIEAMP